MQFINYFFASLSLLLGLLTGVALIRIAPEEQKPLGKYFSFLQKSMLILMFVFLFFAYFDRKLFLVILAIVFALIFFSEWKIRDPQNRTISTYIFLGIFFFLSSRNENYIAIASAITMFYGIAAASIGYTKKKPFQSLLYSTGFILVSNILYLTISRFLS